MTTISTYGQVPHLQGRATRRPAAAQGNWALKDASPSADVNPELVGYTECFWSAYFLVLAKVGLRVFRSCYMLSSSNFCPERLVS